MMLTVIWNPHGFHLIDVRPKLSKFKADDLPPSVSQMDASNLPNLLLKS
jgi:hypothetical protein